MINARGICADCVYDTHPFIHLAQNIVKVVAGWGHSAALTVDGQLYVCGRNFQGQLGLGSPQGFPQVI